MKVVIQMSVSAPEKEKIDLNIRYSETVFESVKTNTSNGYLYTKRFLDIVGSLVGLIMLMPLFLLIGLLIKMEDPQGPVFFKQKRVGKHGGTFDMYKFRSMVCNAEDLKASLQQQNEASGPVFKIKSDPRITKIGKFIRKTSIDELPQLVNVLNGDMTVVGPRPALPDEVAQYTNYEKQRISVTPGLTCFWQVNGRSNISFQEWVEMDLEYIRTRNTTMDIKLIFKTILVLFGSKDAY
ncbi:MULTISPECIES: sugar transferase [Planococcus]|uniref:Multidrug MFS transporter n=2 Tax=Planococcus TaxID=1372 RepID=A0ABM5WUG2_9BACL|nr:MULTISPECIES: sugar transferase [Planococcus]ALS77943.1 multidrug MFS transporter [Planococcus kocurii]AQU80154.1 multidrug MFS transporter [Planococcus faecalis]OHX54243.1 multidrug MFS transporter [Planococcus faecalis]